MLLHGLFMTALFGLWLAAAGSAPLAAGLAIGLMALFMIASNSKHAVLGEPLLFSDLALFAGMFRHPQFYFTAVSARDKILAAVGGAALLAAIGLLFVPRAAPHLTGLAVLLVAGTALMLLLRGGWPRRLVPVPDHDGDLARYGLVATLLLYWQRWRDAADPAPCLPLPAIAGVRNAAEIVVVVQCESFADPVDLTGSAGDALPGLAQARGLAWQWGDLRVSGFGAYTMRTEYGVLFGRSEAQLGFRRYDPFLTAHGETSYALAARLRAEGFRSLFIHPHDMRFYQRDRLMPAIGFERLIGESGFGPATAESGRYVGDIAVADMLGGLIDDAAQPTLLYAVTMENHGPWPKNPPGAALASYLHHLRSGDAMLTALVDRLAAIGRPALLAFFGDHRPSIAGVTEPGGDRHTPYVLIRFAAGGQIVTGENLRADLSPDELHHAILRLVRGDTAAG